MPEAKVPTNLLKLLAIRGEDETGGWENCSLLLRCCFRFCRTWTNDPRLSSHFKHLSCFGLNNIKPPKFLTSVLTSRTDLKSLDIDANLDCVKEEKNSCLIKYTDNAVR